MKSVIISDAILTQTIDRLQAGGARGEERVVLWLARAAGPPPSIVCEVFEPEQITAKDSFYLPPASMQALLAHLRQSRLKVVAQVHSHPELAFHSKADDAWAILRHRGALSLVLPYFARTTSIGSFFDQAKTYALSAANRWEEVPSLGSASPLGAVA